MRASPEEYTVQLQQLLPPGAAWPRDGEAVLTKLMRAFADELARIDGRGMDLIEEADPRTTAEMLTDWETETGLPDPCTGAFADTLQERRAEVVSKLTTRGGQSRQFYIDVAAALGFVITITEFRPFRAGHAGAGDGLTNDEWIRTWRSNGPLTTIRPFLAGGSAAGEPLRDWGNEVLECVLRRLKPAHTHVQFAYGGA